MKSGAVFFDKHKAEISFVRNILYENIGDKFLQTSANTFVGRIIRIPMVIVSIIIATAAASSLA